MKHVCSHVCIRGHTTVKMLIGYAVAIALALHLFAWVFMGQSFLP